MAQRLAKMTLYRAREQMTLQANFSMKAFDVQVGDVVALTIDRYGWTAKEFEVIGWSFRNDPDSGGQTVGLTLRETSSAAFDWNAEETALAANDSTLPSLGSGLTVSNLSIAQATTIASDGTFIVRATATWTAASSIYLDHYNVRWKQSGGEYSESTTTGAAFEFGPLIDSQSFTFEVQAVSEQNIRGQYVSASFTAEADTTAPGLPTSVSAAGGYRSNVITWTNPTDDDLKEIEVYANTSNSSSGASLVGTVTGSAFVHGNLGEQVTRYYFLKSKDFTGNISSFTTSVNATTLADPQDGADGATGPQGPAGSDGNPGQDGDAGARYSTVRYYASGTSAPSTAGLTSNVSFTWSSATATSSYGSWSTTAPTVDAAGSNDYFFVDVTFVDATGEATSSNGTSVTSAVSLFNFNGLVTFTNASGTTTLNDALIDSSTVISGGNITTGTINADRISIDNVTLDTDGSGNLIIASNGVDTTQLAANSVTKAGTSGQSSFTLTAGSTKDVTASITNCDSGSELIILFNWTAGSSTAGDTVNLSILQNGSVASGIGAVTNAPVQDFFGLPSAYMMRITASSGTNTVGVRITANSGNTSSVIGIVYGLFALEVKK